MRKVRTLGIAIVCVQGLLWFQVVPAKAPNNDVYVIQTGAVVPITGRELVPGVDQNNGGRYVASTIGLVTGEDDVGGPVNVVIDPGFSSSPASVIDALTSVGLTPEDITHVFVSHHHPDHTLNAGLFPNATLVDFWATYKVDSVNGPGLLWEDHPDRYEIAPGIEVLRTPGHTYQDASLVVTTKAPKRTVVFTHVWWFWSEGPPNPFPVGAAPDQDPIAEDQLQLDSSRALITAEGADCIVPGHGVPFDPASGGSCSMVQIVAP